MGVLRPVLAPPVDLHIRGSPSIVATFSREERRTGPTRASIRVLTCPIAVSIPRRCVAVKRRAIPAAVVAAGVATGSSNCPATSARRRSKLTRKSPPVSWHEATAIIRPPPDRPRRRSLTSPTPASNAP